MTKKEMTNRIEQAVNEDLLKFIRAEENMKRQIELSATEDSAEQCRYCDDRIAIYNDCKEFLSEQLVFLKSGKGLFKAHKTKRAIEKFAADTVRVWLAKYDVNKIRKALDLTGDMFGEIVGF